MSRVVAIGALTLCWFNLSFFGNEESISMRHDSVEKEFFLFFVILGGFPLSADTARGRTTLSLGLVGEVFRLLVGGSDKSFCVRLDRSLLSVPDLVGRQLVKSTLLERQVVPLPFSVEE